MHPQLVGDHSGVFGVALILTASFAAIAGAVYGHARDMEQAFVASEQHRLQERRRPAHQVHTDPALARVAEGRQFLAAGLKVPLGCLDFPGKDNLALFVKHTVGWKAFPTSKPTQ